MTDQEKEILLEDAAKALEGGNMELFQELRAKYPANPSYVMGMKEILGGDIVRQAGLNFSEVEEKYGQYWYK